MRDIASIVLPPDLDRLIRGVDLRAQKREERVEQRYAEIAKVLVGKRDDAVRHRLASGIEDTWLLCEDAYNGIDDLNRHEYQATRWVKSTSLNAPATNSDANTSGSSKRSTAFVRLTSRYVDAGTAKVCEILLPPNDKAFSFGPTPVPDLIKRRDDHTQAIDSHGIPLWRNQSPDEAYESSLAVPYGAANIVSPKTQQPLGGIVSSPVAPSDDHGRPKRPLTNAEFAIQLLEEAKLKAKRAETRIWDWMTECQHTREMRKVIFDAARLGVGILKGPYPDIRRSTGVVVKDGVIQVQVLEEVVPVDKWVDVWNVFPAPGCGENIRNGDYVFEREFVSRKQLEDLKSLPGYIASQIDLAIANGPSKGRVDTRNPSEDPLEREQRYDLWYYHGVLRREDFSTLNPKALDESPNTDERVFAIVTMAGDVPIRAALNPLNFSGNLPYLSVSWQRRVGHWAGVGVAEQIMVPQRIVNASTRALLNNAGISAGPQIVLNKEAITPSTPGDWTVTPNKIWFASNDGVIDDVRKAFFMFEIPNVTRQMSEIIQYGMRLAEESTSIPLITQGQSGDTTPETLGATQLQNNNANQLLRSIGYRFDDDITEPLVKMYYEYLLLDPNVPEEEKGDFKINAHGSVALVERAIQDQFVIQMSPFTQNPAYGVNPKKWFAIVTKSKHLDPTDFQYSEEEQAIIDSKPVPPPPQVQVAQINAQVKQAQLKQELEIAHAEQQLDLQIAQIEAQSEQAVAQMLQQTNQLRVKLDTDRDTVFVKAEMDRSAAEHTARMEELRLKRELTVMEFSLKHQMSVEQVKAKLADRAMQLRAQKELATASLSADLRKHQTPSAEALLKPPAQTPGKAPDGKAFAQV